SIPYRPGLLSDVMLILDRFAHRPHGQLDGAPRLRIDEERGRLPRLSPAHAVYEDSVVDVHRHPTEAKVPILRETQDDEVRGPQDEVGRGDDVVARGRFHAPPASS